MSDYLQWVEETINTPLDTPGQLVVSGNDIRVCKLSDGRRLLLKIISPERPYVPRIKILGEAAYSLFDYHLNPKGRVSPMVCPVSTDTLWREFLPGTPGEIWRSELYFDHKNLDLADDIIKHRLLVSKPAERIALLDLIFMCQDRSARNWLAHQGGFYAIDNAMLWPYKARFADKQTVRTRSVAHLKKPMKALIPEGGKVVFGNGIFSAIYAGVAYSDEMLDWLCDFDWGEYFAELAQIIAPIYPSGIVEDWRFELVKNRVGQLVGWSRFPTVEEAYSRWDALVEKRPSGSKEIWRLKWEMT